MKWIETKKQLPKNDEFVLVYCLNNANRIDSIDVGYYDDDKNWYDTNYVPLNDFGFFVMYWQKLPKKPKLN